MLVVCPGGDMSAASWSDWDKLYKLLGYKYSNSRVSRDTYSISR